MGTMKDVRDVLSARLKTIPDTNVAHFMPGTINPPQIVLEPGVSERAPGSRAALDYTKAFQHGSTDLSFICLVWVSRAHEESAVEALGAFLDVDGDHSIVSAVEADQQPLRVNGEQVAHFAQVPYCTHYGPGNYNNVSYLVAEFQITVMT